MEIVSLNYFKKLDWKSERLNTLLIKSDPGIWGKKDSEKGIPVLRSTNFNDDGTLDYANPALLKLDNKKRTEKKLNFGDILLERSGGGPNKPVGRVVYFTKKDEEYLYGNFIQRFRVNQDKLDSKFLFYTLYYIHYLGITQKIQNQTTGIRNLDYNSYLNIWIPVPPLVEQRGIVEVLGTVDECIRLTDAAIERAEELKRGLMQQLLTRGIGHTEYKETPLGKIPKTWKISTFGKECNIGTGGTPRRNQPDYYNGNIPWVKSTELNYEIISDTEEHISKRALEESNAKIYPAGTLLIAMYGLEAVGTRGRCAILGVIAATNQAIAAIQPKKQILPRFLYYYYQQMGNLIMKYAEGTKRKNLSLSIIKKIPIIVPPIKEQGKIVIIIENQDDRINLENQKMNQLNILKQGLMQQLLSGKIRVELKEDGLHRIGDSREANN